MFNFFSLTYVLAKDSRNINRVDEMNIKKKKKKKKKKKIFIYCFFNFNLIIFFKKKKKKHIFVLGLKIPPDGNIYFPHEKFLKNARLGAFSGT